MPSALRSCAAKPADEVRVLLAEPTERDQVDRGGPGDDEVVRVPFILGHAGELEEAAEDLDLVGNAELVLVVEGDLVAEIRRADLALAPSGVLDGVVITALALGGDLNAAGDVVVHVAAAMHLDRHVVRDVPALENPGRDEVGLQVHDSADALSGLWKSFASGLRWRSAWIRDREAAATGEHEPHFAGRARDRRVPVRQVERVGLVEDAPVASQFALR